MAAELVALPQYLATGLLELVQAFDRNGVRYALIGGIATSYRSRPRFTRDLDFILEIPQLTLPPLLDDLRERGFSFDTAAVIHQWTQDHLTVLSYQGVRVDWLKPLLPCYQHVIDSATAESVLGASIRVASPEGLIVTKLIAFREQDWLDIQNLLAANRGQLDLEWIRKEWLSVTDLSDSRMRQFEAWVKQYYDAPPAV